jgi:hypothetical protein
VKDEVITKTKKCTQCKRVKSVNLFPKIGKSSSRRRSACKSCTSKAYAKWCKENPTLVKAVNSTSRNKRRQKRREHSRVYHMKVNYGLTWAQYEEMVSKQKGKCAICKKICSTGKRLSVDHDHKTNKIRGLLCLNCNQGLGKLGDDIESLQKALKYLEDNS